ncbi:MAG: hypothetical protein MJ174_07420 [Treponema sp.]|nr:hypothetical protein [Treponema sp.]
MAISANQSILSMLKAYYKKDGVENLLFRNSPLLMKIKKDRVEGKTQNFNAMYSRGGAASGDFTAAKALAATVSKNVEFAVEPGQIFSVYTMNAKEVQASKTHAGAYMKISGAKMFAASESLRKTLAAALYGSGYGELCAAPTNAMTANTALDITLADDVIMKIDVGSKLVIKATKSTAETSATNTLVVNSINGNTVNVTPSATATASSGVLCIAGSTNGIDPLLPMGLDGWLPVTAKRTGSSWTSAIGTLFFGVNRSVSSDRLAGAFYDGTAETVSANQKKSYAVQQLLRKLRRQGSKCDLIVMNDADFLDFAKEIETTNTYFTSTTGKGKKVANVGISEITAGFSTNWVESCFDDPYCVAGRFYILDSSAVEFWGYTNTAPVNDGIANNDPGKQDPMAMDDAGKENDPMQLLVDDLFSVTPGADGVDGPSVLVALNLFGSFVVTNPSVCGVGEFYGSTDFAAA